MKEGEAKINEEKERAIAVDELLKQYVVLEILRLKKEDDVFEFEIKRGDDEGLRKGKNELTQIHNQLIGIEATLRDYGVSFLDMEKAIKELVKKGEISLPKNISVDKLFDYYPDEGFDSEKDIGKILK